MDNLTSLKVLIALLVVEKVVTRSKGEKMLAKAESAFIRGVAIPGDLPQLIEILGDK